MTDVDNFDEFESINEIKKALRQDGDINIDNLEIIFEGGELSITGAVGSEEDLKAIEEIVKDYMGLDAEYHIDVDINEPDDLEYLNDNNNWDSDEYDDDEVEEIDNSDDETLIDDDDY